MADKPRIIARPRRRPVPRSPLYIKSLQIDDLYGKLTYPEFFVRPNENSSGRVSVIYGDNGTGKTTILRLLYACLSTEKHAGLRTHVATVPFKRFIITLSDGTVISFVKDALVGSYTTEIKRQAQPTVRLFIEADSDGIVREQEAVSKLDLALTQIGFDILFVDHNRVVKSTYSFLSELGPSFQPTIRKRDNVYFEYLAEVNSRTNIRLKETDLHFPLPQVVEAVERWFRNQAFKQGAAGDQSAAQVYLEIARALSGRKKKKITEPHMVERNISETLRSLRDTTHSMVKHGLLSDYPFEEFISIYESASNTKRQQIEIVLEPFLDTIERRVAAVYQVNNIIGTFEGEINKYFSNKKASFHIADGLRIEDHNGRINLDYLSSGEKQLVFLLCSAVASRSARSIIIIDEPELSLNYKWQRLIAESLSKISAASNTQFILASHSIEIITRYVNASIELLA